MLTIYHKFLVNYLDICDGDDFPPWQRLTVPLLPTDSEWSNEEGNFDHWSEFDAIAQMESCEKSEGLQVFPEILDSVKDIQNLFFKAT